ncbi:hypothetical protein L2E82_47916 [Cichorium intybus]|uniref:Uncharacterized protein n=1 Tax=Cichorium intybus TaxID=13427 RepID=A0ACB8YWV7_CICIN|nr:hypothetical protein L2E82_47916 [Cichorium intybus]
MKPIQLRRPPSTGTHLAPARVVVLGVLILHLLLIILNGKRRRSLGVKETQRLAHEFGRKSIEGTEDGIHVEYND